MGNRKRIVIVSDGTGRTAKRLMDAVLVQYRQPEIAFELVNTYPQARTRKALDQVLAEIDDQFLVIYSIISRDLSGYFRQQLPAGECSFWMCWGRWSR
jgi:regulator of PEP synthase PpsR (kinase-PPPase family)